MKRITLIFLLLLSSLAFAQEPVSFQLTDEDGLPSNEVYQIVQDKDGFIWIGCEDGLFRYDGNNFRKYRNSAQNGIAVSDLRLDEQNRIWCRNFTGQLYRVDGDSLRTVADVSRAEMASTVYALEPKGNAWLLRNSVLTCFSDKGKVIRKVPIEKFSTSLNVANMLWFDGKVYIAFSSGAVAYLDIASGKIHYLEEPDPLNLTTNVFYIRSAKLYMAKQHTTNGTVTICRYDKGQFKIQHTFNIGQLNGRIFHYGVDAAQNLWICSNDGVKRYDPKMKDLNKVRSIFPGKKVSYILKDREGAYWISTLQDGIFIIPSMDVLRYDTESCGLPENNLTALCLPKGNDVYTGSYTGLIARIDPKSGIAAQLQGTATTVSTKDMICMDDRILVAHGPLSVIQNGVISAQLPVYQLRAMQVRDGRLYYVNTTLSGELVLNETEKSSLDPYGNYLKLGGRGVGVTENGNVYFGLNSGLYLKRKGQRKELRLDGRQIVASSISTIGNKAYIATITHGLLLVENDKVLKRWDQDHGGISDELRFVHANDRFVWISSNDFLYRLDQKDGRIDPFGRSHGIIPKSINSIRTRNGKVFLATDRGLIVFPESLTWGNKIVPKVRFSKLLVDDVRHFSKEHTLIPYDHRSISFVLDVPVFKGKDLAHFRYRFAGTNEWTTQSINQRTLDFNKLAPGNYILEIACSNESGFFGIPIRFAFEVERPYWQKWWFYVLISLISMLLAGALAISRIRYIRKREELKRNALHAQLKALKAQMNPHFMYNALNSIQALIIQKDVMNSNLYLSKFSNLMRKILDASEREFISVSEEIGILELYLDLEKLRFGNEFVYTVIVDPSVDPYAMEIPSVLLQPYVENALKHGLLHKKGEKKLEIQFREEEGVLYCVIRDNGVGRKRSSEIHQRRSDHRSFATEAINKQVELMNDQSGRAIKVEIVDLEDVNGPTGTEVRVWIPQQDFGK